MIGALVTDLLAESERRLAAATPRTLADVREAPALIAFTDEMQAENRALKAFLREHLYQHYQVLRMTTKARRIIHDLFNAFVANPRLLPPQYQDMATSESVARATADYIAGMTDRYSMKEHRRLFSVGEENTGTFWSVPDHRSFLQLARGPDSATRSPASTTAFSASIRARRKNDWRSSSMR